MNALKNILFFGLLIAVLCGVYISLNRQPEQKLPQEFDRDTKPPVISISDNSAAPPQIASVNGPLAGNPPDFPPQQPANSGPPPLGPSGGNYDYPPSPNAPPSVGPAPQSDLPPPPLDRPPPEPPPSNNHSYPPGVREPAAADVPHDQYHAATPDDRYALSNLPPPPAHDAVNVASVARNAVGALGNARLAYDATPNIDVILQQVGLLVHDNKLPEALELLTQLYGRPDVPENQARKISEVLDQMAAKVIYSREHLLERCYYVKPGDTLDTLSDSFHVPALLLARINGLPDPQSLPPAQRSLSPGRQLKVLKGPFSAHVCVERGEMWLALNGRYAGHFPVALSRDLQAITGIYSVSRKSPSATPAGGQWIELSAKADKIAIVPTSDLRNPPSARSTISLNQQDMDDVYGILSYGSRIIIER